MLVVLEMALWLAIKLESRSICIRYQQLVLRKNIYKVINRNKRS